MLCRLRIGLLFFVLCFFGFMRPAYGAYIFYDDFNTRDPVMWNYLSGDGLVDYAGGVMSLSSTQYYFPYVENNGELNLPEDQNFKIKIRFKFSSVGHMGSGLGIGFTGNSVDPNYFQFGIWRGINDGFHFYYNDFSSVGRGLCQPSGPYIRDMLGRQYVGLQSGDGSWHLLEIERKGTAYNVYFDRESGGGLIFSSLSDQCIPKKVWLGNRLPGGSTDWTGLQVDYVKAYVGEEIVKNKIIVVPGLGASWNTRAMIYGETVPDDQWQMTPFLHVYDGLISAFEGKGLVRNKDFFVWNYDWTRPVSEIETNLDEFINQKIAVGEKVDLVGHSLGGLVSRVWSQNHLNKIGKVISLGSPHQGAINAYEPWSGGKIINDITDLGSVAMKIVTKIRKSGFESDMATVRAIAPILKDLLPTSDFIKKNGVVIPVSVMESKNNYLVSKNLSAGLIFDKFLAVVGLQYSTKEWIEVQERGAFDKVLRIWPDGKPKAYVFGDGDGTVTKKRAFLNGDVADEMVSRHKELPDLAIGNIFRELGLGNTGSVISSIDTSGAMVFFIGSPAYLDVKCGDGGSVVSDNMGFAVVNNPTGVCEVKVIGTGNGKYHLVTGMIGNDDSWDYFSGEIEMGKTDVLRINGSSGILVMDEASLDYLLGLIKIDLKILLSEYVGNEYLSKAITAVDNKDITGIINNLFSFRKTHKGNRVADRILDNLEKVLEINNKNVSKLVAEQVYTKASQDKSMVDRNTRLLQTRRIVPSSLAAISYLKLESFVDGSAEDLKNGKYPSAWAKATLGSKLSGEIW